MGPAVAAGRLLTGEGGKIDMSDESGWGEAQFSFTEVDNGDFGVVMGVGVGFGAPIVSEGLPPEMRPMLAVSLVTLCDRGCPGHVDVYGVPLPVMAGLHGQISGLRSTLPDELKERWDAELRKVQEHSEKSLAELRADIARRGGADLG